MGDDHAGFHLAGGGGREWFRQLGEEEEPSDVPGLVLEATSEDIEAVDGSGARTSDGSGVEHLLG